MNDRATSKWGVLLLACCLAACSVDETGEQTAFSDPTIMAVVGDRQVTAAEVRNYIASRPLATGSVAAARGVTSVVEEMVTAEALQQEALRQGLDRDPEVQRIIRQILIQKLLADQVTKPVVGRQISDTELEAYFEQHRAEYAWPEQVRLAVIFIAVPEGASNSVREAKREQAGTVLSAAREAKGRRFGFSELVRKHSDEHPRFSLGDTGFFDRDGKPAGLEPSLAQAAFSLQRNGELFDGVVETGLGFHVIMRVGHRSAVSKSYKDVADELTQRIRREALTERRRSYIGSVREGTLVRINDLAIAALAAELGASSAKRVAKGSPSAAGRGGAMPPPLSVGGD